MEDTAYQGDSRSIVITVLDDVGTDPLNLDGYAATWALYQATDGGQPMVRHADGGVSLSPATRQVLAKTSADGGITVADAATGTLQLLLTPDDTADLVGKYVHVAHLTKAGTRLTVVAGVLEFRRTVPQAGG
ncbi:hypothetical protein FVW20_00650 [Desulfovibrio oxamicus]|uniref:Uncharacterized protein n=1 Tax=Nitratidesulfovibrio oxamicus TaxID=32016 RepID=A0ABS0IZH2_9BACT|nr:hypothetical protein [Nitratidesulfovibrio oxamicus]MBG3875572.1 hypothetical protein [Nitratidesulfovibrio oxamicus]